MVTEEGWDGTESLHWRFALFETPLYYIQWRWGALSQMAASAGDGSFTLWCWSKNSPVRGA